MRDFWFGGERGIRTLDTGLPHTRFPGVRLQPLGHPSADEFARQNINTIGRRGNMESFDKLTPRGIFSMIILNDGVISNWISLAPS